MNLVDDIKTLREENAELRKRVEALEKKKSRWKAVEISTPEIDEEMFFAPDHAGVDALTKPYHYRGQVFGVGDTVPSVKASIKRWEHILKEGGGGDDFGQD